MEVSGNNISMIRGDTDAIEISAEDGDGVAIPLVEGDTIYFTVKENTETDDKILQKIITDFTLGEALITLFPADTKDLEAGVYVYDIQWTKASGEVRTIVPPSQFTLRGDVTYE